MGQLEVLRSLSALQPEDSAGAAHYLASSCKIHSKFTRNMCSHPSQEIVQIPSLEISKEKHSSCSAILQRFTLVTTINSSND